MAIGRESRGSFVRECEPDDVPVDKKRELDDEAKPVANACPECQYVDGVTAGCVSRVGDDVNNGKEELIVHAEATRERMESAGVRAAGDDRNRSTY